MSACAADYAKAIANPFDGPLACIPDFPALYSSKQRVWAKGSLSTSATTGFGFIMVNPFNMACNNLGAVSYSTSAYTGTNTTVPPTAGVSEAFSNSQYASSDFGSAANLSQYRIVGCGLRIRYMGTELNRGGYKIGFADPTHSSCQGQTTTTIRLEPESVEFAITRTWSTVLYRPVINSELNYQTDFSLGTNMMCFLIQAASATTPLEYEWQAFAVIEYQGRTIKGMTPSHSDPVGFSAVNASALTLNALRPSAIPDQERERLTLTSAASYLAKGTSTVAAITKDVASAASLGATVVSNASSIWNSLSSVASVIEPMLLAL